MLKRKDLQKGNSQTQPTWDKRTLEKLLDLSQPDSFTEFQETLREMMKDRQQQAKQALQKLRTLQSEGKHRQEEAERRKEAELRQEMEIPEECWSRLGVPQKDVTETREKYLKEVEQKVSIVENSQIETYYKEHLEGWTCREFIRQARKRNW